MTKTDSPFPTVLLRAWHGVLAGVYSGTIVSLLSFVLYREASMPFLFGTGHAIHSYAYTIAIYSVLGGIVGAALGVILGALGTALPFLRGRPFWGLLLLPFACLIPFIFVNARWQIEVPRNVSLYDAYRIAFLQKSLAMSALAGLVVSVVLTLVFYGRSCWRWGRRIHAVFVPAALVVAGLTLAQVHLMHGRIDWSRAQGASGPRTSDLNVILVGLDGATWTILAPMLKEGRLPHMKAFLEDAAYGPLQVYGKAFSPSVWTTMVTGVKRDVHGIVSYTVSGEEGTYMAGSNHRKVPALWNIVNQAGLATGLINYMVSYPPEHVLGINLSRMIPVGAIPYEEKVWPPSLIPEVSALVEDVPPADGVDDHAVDLNHELAVLTRLFEEYWDPAFSFFTVYTHSTDDVEHRYWSFMFPEDFEGTPLEPSEADIAAKHDVIRGHWERADLIFEHLNSIVDANTVVIVVSDHGMESATAPEAHLALNDLLSAMGLLAFTEEGGIDTSRTLAYWPSGSDVNMRATGIRINEDAIPNFPACGTSYEEARAYVIDRLRAVRLTGDGETLFPAVLRSEDETDPTYREPLSSSDVIVHLSAYTRGARMDDSLDLDDGTIPMTDVVVVKEDVTGAHHPRGVIMARGLPFKEGPAFARPTVETPVSDVLQRVLGRAPRLDGAMKAAQFLGLVDRATTLDICQTILYLLGVPCAEYMQGRVLAEGMDRSYVAEHRGTMVSDYGELDREVDEKSAPSPEELERLRSLGYVD